MIRCVNFEKNRLFSEFISFRSLLIINLSTFAYLMLPQGFKWVCYVFVLLNTSSFIENKWFLNCWPFFTHRRSDLTILDLSLAYCFYCFMEWPSWILESLASSRKVIIFVINVLFRWICFPGSPGNCIKKIKIATKMKNTYLDTITAIHI